jgi:hypothetical protein
MLLGSIRGAAISIDTYVIHTELLPVKPRNCIFYLPADWMNGGVQVCGGGLQQSAQLFRFSDF